LKITDNNCRNGSIASFVPTTDNDHIAPSQDLVKIAVFQRSITSEYLKGSFQILEVGQSNLFQLKFTPYLP
jgi:hypothetical protein